MNGLFALGRCPPPSVFRRDKKVAASDMTLAAAWWRRMDSNHRRRSQQIYSLSPLATWVLLHIQLNERSGAGGRIRTPDLLITNQLLYQLSYTSTVLLPRSQRSLL